MKGSTMAAARPRNARFWFFLNCGPVKITLTPGQQLEHVQGGPCDEGWSSEAHSWELEGDTVHAEYANEGRDCDGRHGWYSSSVCDVADLRAGAWPDGVDLEGDRWPKWENASASQYDQFAELAGY